MIQVNFLPFFIFVAYAYDSAYAYVYALPMSVCFDLLLSRVVH